MTYFSRDSRVGKKVRKNLSFLFIVLMLALSMVLVRNLRSINDVQIVNNQSQILSSDSELIWEKTWVVMEPM